MKLLVLLLLRGVECWLGLVLTKIHQVLVLAGCGFWPKFNNRTSVVRIYNWNWDFIMSLAILCLIKTGTKRLQASYIFVPLIVSCCKTSRKHEVLQGMVRITRLLLSKCVSNYADSKNLWIGHFKLNWNWTFW